MNNTLSWIGTWIGTWDWGNVADWVSGIGAILAILVSLFILYYQTKKSIEMTSRQFFIERNNNSFDKAEVLLVNDWYTLGEIRKQVKDIMSTKTYSFNESSININNAKRVSYFIEQLTEMKRNLVVFLALLARFEEKSSIDNLTKGIKGNSIVTEINSDLVELIKNFNENNDCQDNYRKILETINKLDENYKQERDVIIELRRAINS